MHTRTREAEGQAGSKIGGPGLDLALLLMYDSLVMSSDPVSGTYADQMAADLRKRIDGGEFGATGKLPSDRELGKQYGRSRTVVHNVLARLRSEGRIYARERFGYYVRGATPVTVSVSAGVTAPGDAGPARTVVQVHVLGGPDSPIPPDVLGRLNLQPGELVIERDRVCYLGDTPYMLLPSWYPESLAEGSHLMRPVEQSTHGGGLLAGLGIEATPDDDYVLARMATPEEAARLGLRDATPVLDWLRTFRGGGRKPVAVQRAVMPGDRAALAGLIT